MNSANTYTTHTPNTSPSPGIKENSYQETFFTLWINLEKSLQTITENDTESLIDTSDNDSKLDAIVDAQDEIANAVCQSRAETYEDLLYKVAMWRSDTPDFETMPIDADRKDRIIYSVFRDLIQITGMDKLKTNIDDKTNFLGM